MPFCLLSHEASLHLIIQGKLYAKFMDYISSMSLSKLLAIWHRRVGSNLLGGFDALRSAQRRRRYDQHAALIYYTSVSGIRLG